jgi:hypothetical protein
MSLRKTAIAVVALAAFAAPAHAKGRADVQTYPIESIRALPEYQEKIGNFRFVWGNNPGRGLGTTQTRKATNGVNKSDEAACAWAALSALIALKADAEKRGGSSVQGLKSNVTGTPFSSSTEFQCISGFTNSRVYFQGVVAR